MSLDDRRGYALQALYYGSVRSAPEAVAERDITALSKIVLDLATKAVEGDETEDLDVFLRNSISNIRTSFKIFGRAEDQSDAEVILGLMEWRVSQVQCVVCGEGRVCKGENPVLDDEIVASEEGGVCIAEIKNQFARSKTIAYGSYWEHKTGDFPQLVLTTSGDRPPEDTFIGRNLSVSGVTHFVDDDIVKSSRIRVSVEALALGRECLAALPYLVLHEVFCHGFQMMNAPSKRPKRGLVADPIAEGLVDAAAVEIMRRLADEEMRRGLPGAELTARSSAEAEVLHAERGSIDRKPLSRDAKFVRLGMSVWSAVVALYKADREPEAAESDTIIFAMCLNLLAWDYVARFAFLSRLFAAVKQRDTNLLSALLRFRSDYNIDLVAACLP